jgi:hypothetical protein
MELEWKAQQTGLGYSHSACFAWAWGTRGYTGTQHIVTTRNQAFGEYTTSSFAWTGFGGAHAHA